MGIEPNPVFKEWRCGKEKRIDIEAPSFCGGHLSPETRVVIQSTCANRAETNGRILTSKPPPRYVVKPVELTPPPEKVPPPNKACAKGFTPRARACTSGPKV